MRKKTTNRVYVRPQYYTDKVVSLVYHHHRNIDLRPMYHLVKKCMKAFDVERNPMAMVSTYYSSLALQTGLDVRVVRRTLDFLSEVGMLTNVTEGHRHTFILLGLTTYEGEQSSYIYIQERKERKKKEKSPCTPFEKKENKEKKEGPLALENCASARNPRCGERRVIEGSVARARDGSVEERRQCFIEDLRPYVGKYGAGMCNDFYNHWTELTKDKCTMRFEREEVWELEKRLIAWARHGMKFDAKGGKAKQAAPASSAWIDDATASEKRRLSEMLESVPPFAIELLKKHGLYANDMNASDIYLKILQRYHSFVLTDEEKQHFIRWKSEREKLQKMLEHVKQA